MNSFLQDIRFGARLLRKSPGFTIVALLVLSLAIGGTTAMFSIINALVLKPLPVEEPERLVRFYGKINRPDRSYRSFSHPYFSELRERNSVFEQLTAFALAMAGHNEGDTTRRIFTAIVPANYFDAMGAPIRKGRAFTAEEERPGSGIASVVVSHSFWVKRGADPQLIGKTVTLNARPFQVVGIAPEFFTGATAMFSPDFWVPLGSYELIANDFTNERKLALSDINNHPLMLVGRLKHGVSMQAAESQLQGIAKQLEAAHPDVNKDATVELGKLTRLSMNTYPQNDTGMGILAALLLAMSGAVLLIACLNLANMLLARSAARKREIAIRLAMGGGRARLIRQLLTEGLILALVGGTAGLWLASWGSAVLFSSLETKLSFVTVVFDPTPDWRVVAVTFLTCTASVLLFALGPAWKLSRGSITNELKEVAGEEMGRTRGLFSMRNMLVGGQLALSLALLTAAGLFTRAAVVAANLNPGFSFDNALLVETDAALGGLDEARGKQVYMQLLERLRSVPGVQAASVANIVPFGIYSDSRDIRRVGAGTGTNANPTAGATYNIIANHYFEAVGIPMLRGRDFDAVEIGPDAKAKVAIIDEPLAKKLFGEEDPVGQYVAYDKEEPVMIVGIAGGIKNELDDKELKPHIYVPFGPQYRSGMNIHVRAASNGQDQASHLLASVREAIRAVDPRFPVLSLQTFRQFHEEGLRMWFVKTAAKLFTLFGLLALALAVLGIYGVKSYVVSRRTREIGIRMAIGASNRDILWLVMKDGLRLAGFGLGVGMLLALAVGFALRSFLFGLSAVDPVTFVLAPVCLGIAALLACYIPARRATLVEPMKALRYE